MDTPELIKIVENKILQHPANQTLLSLKLSTKDFKDFLIKTYQHNENIFKFISVSDEKTYRNQSIQIYHNRKISELLNDIDDDLIYYRFNITSKKITDKDVIEYLTFILTEKTIKQAQKYNDLEVLSILVSNFTNENKWNEIHLIVSKRVQETMDYIEKQNNLNVKELNIILS